MKMLKIEDLSIHIEGKKIIDSLNVSFNVGQVSAIYGFNGIGKTTLFNCIYGLYNYKGSITYHDSLIKKTDCSYLMTENYYYPNLLAREYLDIFQNTSSLAIFNIENLSEILEIPLDQNIDTFSTGMKRKLSFISVVKLNRNVFLLDEPFNGVDHESILYMKKVIQILKENSKAIIITSHVHSHLIDLCENILIIESAQKHFQLSNQKFKSYLYDFQNIVEKRFQEVLLPNNPKNI